MLNFILLLLARSAASEGQVDHTAVTKDGGKKREMMAMLNAYQGSLRAFQAWIQAEKPEHISEMDWDTTILVSVRFHSTCNVFQDDHDQTHNPTGQHWESIQDKHYWGGIIGRKQA